MQLKRRTKRIIWWTLTIAVVALISYAYVLADSRPGPLDDFAKCIANKGMKFYGAFWCPHCQAQKAAFGRSAKYLPYIECSLPNQSQNMTCNAENIESYPTWVFPDGSRMTGEVSLEDLAKKSGCELPSSTTPNAS